MARVVTHFGFFTEFREGLSGQRFFRSRPDFAGIRSRAEDEPLSEVDITALLADQNYASIVAHRPIASEDLRGKQIGYALGSNSHYMLLRLLSGVDLSLTKALVDLHGGSLELQSQVGVGTTVTVRFPAERIVQLPDSARALEVDDRAAS